jgi:inner membrane protein
LDNLTHSLFGAALAGVAVPSGAPPARRRFFYAAGIVAANLPDLDLAYTAVTPAPLGYLLHHRGHTHTLAALVVQWVILAAAGHAAPAGRGLGASDRGRLWLLLAAGLLSHILLDSGNSYGVHPFFPFDNRWYYGDAVFIFEPWLWLLLGVPVAMAAMRRGIRVALLGLLAVLPLALAAGGLVPWRAVAALLLAALILGAIVSRLSPRGRPLAALAACAVFLAAMFGLSRLAHSQVRALLRPSAGGAVLDVVLTPDPANPSCWSVIAIEKYEALSEYVLRPATLSLFPGGQPPTTCASHRFGGARPFRDVEGRMAAYEEIRQPLARLRKLAQRDCGVAAWLQFGRAPVIDDGRIFDLRFEARGDNFTAMALRPPEDGATCPPHLTRWMPPRADLLQP